MPEVERSGTTTLTTQQVEELSNEAVRLISQLGDAVLNAVDQGIVCLDARGRTMFVNEAATRMLGFTLRELIGKSAHSMTHHHYHDGSVFPESECPIMASVSDGVHQRVGGDIFWRKDGRQLPVDYTSIPIREGRKIVAVVVTFRDVTTEKDAREQAERLAAERAAREEAERGKAAVLEAESRFRLALEAGQLGTWEWDIVNQRVMWSPQEEAMYGLQPGEFSGSIEEYVSRIHPDDRETAMQKVQEALARKAATHDILHRIVRPDGEVRYIDSHGRFTYDADGSPLRLSGVSADITERHLAAEQLRRSDARFKALRQASGQIVWTNSAEGRMEGEQPEWGEFTGQSLEEYQGFGWAQAVHPDDSQPTIDAWNEAVRERRMFVFEHRLKRKDGVYRRFAIRGVPIVNDQGQIEEWVGIHTDVTETRETEQARDRALVEAQIARSDLQRIFEQAPAAIAVTSGPNHVFQSVNDSYRRLIGNRDVLGKAIREVFQDEATRPFLELMDRVYQTGEPYVGYRVPATIDRGNGPQEGIFSFVYQPMLAADGSVNGIMVHAVENEAAPVQS